MKYDARWRRVRLVVLERDGYLCRIRGPRCLGVADQVDHVIRPQDGGAWYDEANLRGACAPCNVGRQPRWSTASSSPPPSREW